MNPNESQPPQQPNHPIEAVPPQPDATQPPAQAPYQPAQPPAEMQAAAPQDSSAPKEHTNAGLIVLQWLTYAFWGWTVLALSFLITSVIANYVSDADTSGFTPYTIAAVLVLLPISFICDTYYSKKERSKKSGAEMLVMIIHAVIFALFGIGSLIVAVFSIVQLLTGSTDTSGSKVALYSSLIIAVLYALTFLRTLAPPVAAPVRRFYRWIMLVAVGIIALLAIIGPVAQERVTRDDRLISTHLPSIQTAINGHVRNNGRLPESLKELKLTGDSRQLVDRNLVEYRPQKTAVAEETYSGTTSSTPVYRYELCVNYSQESSNYGEYPDYSYLDAEPDGYSSYLTAYEHPAGEVCYKLRTSEY